MLTCKSWTIRGDAVFDKSFIDEFDTLGITIIVRRDREIHSHSSVNLNINKSRRNNLAAEIDDTIWHRKVVVENFLRIDNDTFSRVNPKILFYQNPIDSKSTISEFDEHICPSFCRGMFAEGENAEQSNDPRQLVQLFVEGMAGYTER